MQELLLDQALKKVEYTYRWTGLNVESSKKTKGENQRYKIVYFFNLIWLNMDVAGAIAWFIDNARKGASFTMLTYVAPCVFIGILATSKSLLFLLHDKEIDQLLKILRNLEMKYYDNSVKKQKIIQTLVKFLFMALNILNFFSWSLLVAFPLMPLSIMALEYYYTRNIVTQLPFLVVYPFDAYDLKYWPFVYLRQIWDSIVDFGFIQITVTSFLYIIFPAVVVIIIISGVDYFFFICITFICIQFKLLQYEVTNLISERYRQFSLMQSDDDLQERLVEIVRWHQDLIHLAELLELIYSKAILINFVFSSLLLCLCGFNVMMLDDPPLIISFGTFLFMCLTQILSLCYFGDLLLRYSTEVSDAMYDSRWHLILSSKRIRKDFNIIQMRAQKPCKITAHRFADVNLKAFMKILSTSWSYFALLKTVYSTPQEQ